MCANRYLEKYLAAVSQSQPKDQVRFKKHSKKAIEVSMLIEIFYNIFAVTVACHVTIHLFIRA